LDTVCLQMHNKASLKRKGFGEAWALGGKRSRGVRRITNPGDDICPDRFEDWIGGMNISARAGEVGGGTNKRKPHALKAGRVLKKKRGSIQKMETSTEGVLA